MPTFIRIPRPSELQEVSGISNLIDSIAQYVTPSHDKDHVAVVIVYAALCEALVREHIIDYSDIPELRYRYKGEGYITYKSTQSTGKRGMLEDRAGMNARSKRAGHHPGHHACVVRLLGQLQQWCTEAALDPRGAKRKASESQDEGHEQGSAIELMKNKMDDITACEQEMRRVTCMANLAYYRLGHAYVSWVRQALPSVDARYTTPEFHRKVFPQICKEYADAHSGSDLARTPGFRKKLVRARKFLALGEILGPQCLSGCRDLSVAKVDAIQMSVLDSLLKEFPDEIRAMRGARDA